MFHVAGKFFESLKYGNVFNLPSYLIKKLVAMEYLKLEIIITKNFKAILILSSNSHVIHNIRFQSFMCGLFYSLKVFRIFSLLFNLKLLDNVLWKSSKFHCLSRRCEGEPF